jgi:hypothetical protein
MFYSIEECLSHKPSGDNKEFLFTYQKHTLDILLNAGAIEREDYDKTLAVLADKMGIKEYYHKENPVYGTH